MNIRRTNILRASVAACITWVLVALAVSPPEGNAQEIGYVPGASWTGFPGASRIVTGPSDAVWVLAGGTIHELDANGTVLGERSSEGAREFAIDERGSLYGVVGQRVFKRPGYGISWDYEYRGDYHRRYPNLYRDVYISTIAYNDETERVTAIWENSEVATTGFNSAGVRREEFVPTSPRHAYWDLDYRGGVAYALNRTTNQVEIYDRTYVMTGTVPLPAPAERLAVGPNGDIFVLVGREWIYQLDPSGGVLDAWDASDTEPGIEPHNIADLDVTADGRVLVADRVRGVVREYVQGEVERPIGAPPSPDPICQTVPFKTASPTHLQLGELTQVTLRLGGSCPILAEKADIALVVDRSGSMEGEKIAAARASVESFVRSMDLTRDRVSLISFESFPQLRVGLTQDADAVIDAARSLSSEGGTDIAAGIDVAVQELRRSARWGDPSVKPIIVLMTDGVPFNNTRLTTVASADRARYAGITMFTIGLGSDVDPQLLRLVATAPVLYYEAPTADKLAEVYDRIARRIAASVLMESVTITDIVPENMAYQVGSAEPPAAWDPQSRTLTWTFEDVPFQGIEMTYWLEPLQLGRHPTNIRADYDGIDGLDQPQIGPFPVPYVVVVGPETPSPTAPPPSVTPTDAPTRPPTSTATATPRDPAGPTATDSPTATATPIASSTPHRASPTPYPTATEKIPRETGDMIYVPIVFNESCVRVYTDVTLVIDASTTMLEKTGGGRTKLDATKDAAKRFIDGLLLERDMFNRHDQAAVVWYNDRAAVASSLTNDRARLAAAIDSIRPAEGSRIDLGLEFGHRELLLSFSEGRILANTPVIILLSDGKPNRTSIDRVLQAADAAKRDGILVYAVGHGRLPGTHSEADYWPHVLGRIASQPEMYIHAPNVEDLAGIYARLAGRLVCR